jgi:uncharacterized membrane protein
MSTAPARIAPVPADGEAGVRAASGLAAERVWVLVVVGAVAAWSTTLLLLARNRYADYRYGRYDLGNMVQAVWSTAHGHFLESTHGLTGEQTSRLGSHVDPILGLLAPLWLVFPTPLMLAFVQVVAVASGALPLFWIARRRLSSARAAGLLALAYLAYPWTAWAALDVFHPVVLAIPLFLFCVWFLETERLVPFAVCAVLAAATGELMGVSVAALGIWYALTHGRRKAGLAIALLGVGWTLVAVKVIVPAYSGGQSLFFGAYQTVGGSPWGLVRTTFTHPLVVVSALTSGKDIEYVVLLLAPLAGASLLAPGMAAVALPALAANMLADRQHTVDPHVHYVGGVIPFLFAAIAIGLDRLSGAWRANGAALVLTLAFVFSMAVGPWPGTLLGAENWDNDDTLDTSPAHVRALDRAVALVPSGAPVSATNRVGSHLADRRYTYPVPLLGRAKWAVVETADSWIPVTFAGTNDPAAIARFQERLDRNPQWHRVFAGSGVYVYRRDGP